jgi:hypothetical protein
MPWYREPWPWLLMLGPAIVVVAGVNMMVVAFRGADGLVADDYYRQGLGINRTLARDAKAASLGLAAALQLDRETSTVRIVVQGAAGDAPSLTLALRHPTRAAGDRSIPLARVSAGVYQGRLPAAPDVAWRLQLEDGAGGWRLTGRWAAGMSAAALRHGG